MSTITLVQGEDRKLTFTLQEIDEKEVTTYMDLTGASEIEVRSAAASSGTPYISFKKTDTEVTILDAKGGIFQVTMSDTKTGLMKLGSEQNLEVIVDIGSERRIAQLLKSITVIKRLFPTP